MPLRRAVFAILFASLGSPLVAAETPLRLERLERCGDLLASERQEWCLRVRGLGAGLPRLLLDGRELPATALRREGDGLRLRLDRRGHASGPLWLEQGGRSSNPVWLTLNGSHVLAAGPDEVAKNMDGLTTYVDLVSLLIEENHDGRREAERLADKYGARVVGAIPPLNLYQLRLPARDLVQRDALVLRIGSETSVDAVVVEESAPEKGEETEAARRPVDKPDSLYARDAERPDNHGSTVAGILAARWDQGGNSGFLRGLDRASQGFEVIVERNSDAGITANVAASVNLVEDGVRVLNWSWGIHRVGARDVDGDEVDSLVRSGIAMSGYEELLEEFFLWLRKEHPDVLVVNSAGNGSSYSGTDEYRLPSSFVTEQLLVVGGHQRSERQGLAVDDPAYAVKRSTSNVDMRVDVTAAACTHASTLERDARGEVHCGTSYATPMVAGTVAAMLSLNPRLRPEEIRMLLRRSAMTIGGDYDFEPADAEDLTAPILPSERGYRLDHRDVGRSARLDMQKALDLAVKSRERVR
ncbi:S8/S53 family peptidase [Pseudomonas aeruginosa]|uniref:S8/S53 family peptidase n=1 Tax=Pseudomonas aeruginosa TaxID=287 RepID=UPI00104C8C02|nr:S8/S53 family peptidase [Pseudomonas aeruginosa]